MKPLAVAAWTLFVVLALLAESLPLGVEAQLALAVAALAAMLLIKGLRLGGPWRSVLLALGAFVVMRYVFWRFASTIPPITSPIDFAAGSLLVIAECYCVAMLFLSLFTVVQPIDRAKAPPLSDDQLPSVDVFVPSYNEGIDIVGPTLAAARRMTYPSGKLNVFLLDDGGTDQKVQSDDPNVAARATKRRQALQSLCVELGVRYLTREANVHAKAGNLNNGLANSDSDLVVVFDADHIPAQNFLQETVGYFKQDEKLFLVQTPHFFLNPDPIEKNLSARAMPTENEMFYGLVQKGLDKWNAAFFCGSAAVLRRQALEEVGGFHGSSITEDAESALELHSRGWNSLYVETPLIAGLQPETFDAFITQRSRWCRGMVQILLLKNPLMKKGLTLPQRLSYLSSSLFWLFPLSRMVFIFAPMLYIFFDLKIYIANQQEFIAYTLTYMLAGMLIQSYIFRRVRWPWISDVYEYIQSVMLFRAVLSVFIDPHNPKFEVTAKGQTLEDDRLSAVALPYFVMFGLVAASAVFLGWRFVNEPASRDLLLVVGVWTALNLVLTGIGLGAVCELRERRSMPRVSTRSGATLSVGADNHPVTVENLSFGGLLVRVPATLQLPARTTGILRIEDGLSPTSAQEAQVISIGRRTLDGGRGAGLRFYGTSGDRYRMIAKLAFSDMVPMARRRRAGSTEIGLLRGSIMIVVWAVRQTIRSSYYALFRRGKPSAVPIPAATEGITA